MPATFAHCLLAQYAIDKVQEELKRDTTQGKEIEYAQKIGENNNFVIIGAAGPDYPYLTDILLTSVLAIEHTWANRMHYENTLSFAKEGVKKLIPMDQHGEPFAIRLAWFCGLVSHIMADSFLHPIINSIVRGIYLFTHEEHAKCELIQDIFIFQKIKREDIVVSNPRSGSLGYLRILEECSDPNDQNRIHPEIRSFWSEILEAAHPNGSQYFKDIVPDRWHHNYKSRVNFVAEPGAIFRHVVGLTDRAYKRDSEITTEEREKYIDKISLPDGNTSDYYTQFNKAVTLVVNTWIKLFKDIAERNQDRVATYIKDWNLDTGVDESQVDLWQVQEA